MNNKSMEIFVIMRGGHSIPTQFWSEVENKWIPEISSASKYEKDETEFLPLKKDGIWKKI